MDIRAEKGRKTKKEFINVLKASEKGQIWKDKNY
jgi:hypothetical protein